MSSLKKGPQSEQREDGVQIKAFAEVIESSLQNFLAQSWQWHDFPQFGALVVVENKKLTLYGLVYQINTGSMDPVRYPFPYKKTHEELLAEQPQIFEFLKTTFQVVTLGYEKHEKISYGIAPHPPLIHSFVAPASSAQAQHFFSHDRYIQVLFSLASSLSCALDELLIACLRYQKEEKILHEEKLVSLLEHFSLLAGNDYRRLKLLSQRIEMML